LLDVVTKLVELGAEWPHGKIAAVTGNDVVQLLVENYKGAKKLQVGLFWVLSIVLGAFYGTDSCRRLWFTSWALHGWLGGGFQVIE
jgi:hypothetical protein